MNIPLARILIMVNLLAALLFSVAHAKEDVLKPYDGPVMKEVDPTTMKGKVVTGYQGWFNAPGDGSNNPPFGNGGVLIDYEGLPSDFYLRLSGKAAQLYREEIPLSKEIPISEESSR